MEKIAKGPFIPLPLVPIGLVGANVAGKPNYMTVGFVSGVNMQPPIVSVSLNRQHYTPRGIRENGTFSLNIPSADFAAETDYCGLVSGKNTEKSALFTTFYGELETAPMIEGFPLVCECRLVGEPRDFAMDTVYFGEVCQVYANQEILSSQETPDILKANPLLAGMDGLYRGAGESLGRAYHMGWSYSPPKTPPEEGGPASFAGGITEQPSQPCLYIRPEAAENLLPRIIGESLQAIARYAETQGAVPCGPPFAAYRDSGGHGTGMEIGFPFPHEMKGNGNIRSGEIPGGKTATFLHTGPYEQLGAARASLHRWAAEQGWDHPGILYEFYLNDPRTTPAEELQTRLVLPLP